MKTLGGEHPLGVFSEFFSSLKSIEIFILFYFIIVYTVMIVPVFSPFTPLCQAHPPAKEIFKS